VTESDEQLVRRHLDGDVRAFTTLVERHETRLYNVCLRILGSSEDARDATQDAFLTALRKLDQFRGDAAFSTWMHRVAVNACYDMLRKRKRQPMLRLVPDDESGPGDDPGPPEPDPSDAVAGAIDAGRALAKVPEDFRIVLVLADVEDLPYEEIARVLDLPIGTVKSRVHRGRIALARAMGLESSIDRVREPQPTAPASEEER
jgi:RNA polymerase sigma-70 factor (ECF subfamily)